MLINCDMGEYHDSATALREQRIMPLIDIANIACGGHIGDELSMQTTVELCLAHEVLISAHPSFEDRDSFGRKPQPIDSIQLHALLDHQCTALYEACVRLSAKCTYIKAHGALYHLVNDDPEASIAFITWLDQNQLELLPICRLHSHLERTLVRNNIPHLKEIFADRGYDRHGRLIQRGEPGAVLETKAIARHVNDLLSDLGNMADTICIHSDHDDSIETARSIRHILRDD